MRTCRILAERDSGRPDMAAPAGSSRPVVPINERWPSFLLRRGEAAGEKHNDLYIAFTSMHEAVIHNCSKESGDDTGEFKSDLNREMPSDDDFLSGKAWLIGQPRERQDEVALWEY